MSFWDWLIVVIPVSFVMYMGYHSRTYIRQVSDFLSAGRVCGRYVLCVGDIANGLAIVALVGYVERTYGTGFALNFWTNLLVPLTMILSLTGFCVYRFRETRAMSLGQFLEMRYGSRNFRIFSALLRTSSEILANMIMPAIAARFFIYYLGLPGKLSCFGFSVDTFAIVVLITLTLAISLICFGGQLALTITDSIQGMFCYPLMVFFVCFILSKFSWSQEIAPVMMDRVSGQSFLNPYDVHDLRNFNLFLVGYNAIQAILNLPMWIGAGSCSAAKSPHEQKMANILGSWRQMLTWMFYLLISLLLLTVLNHKNFAVQAKELRTKICARVSDDLLHESPAMRHAVDHALAEIPPQHHEIGKDKPLSQKENLDTVYLEKAKEVILAHLPKNSSGRAEAYKLAQGFYTLYHQTMMAICMRNMLPTGAVGLFCLLMILAMVSTDDTRIFSSSLTFTQDVLIPILQNRNVTLTPQKHIKIIRLVSIGVGVIFFIGSFVMSQLAYIQLFTSAMTMIWIGAGPMLIFGFYSRFGTIQGAWSSLLAGMFLAVSYILLQQHWTTFYQFLAAHGLVDGVAFVLNTCCRPFGSFMVWEMNPQVIPINSIEANFIVVIVTFVIYIIVSRLTMKQPFNLEKMLHRGKYNLEETEKKQSIWTWKNFFSKFIGITPEYTCGDKITAWVMFCFSFGYSFFLMFVCVAIYNVFSPWPLAWWSRYFFIQSLIVPGIIACIVAVWFSIGGIRDMIQMFRDLKKRTINLLDDGRVDGNVSLADKAQLDEIDENKKL